MREQTTQDDIISAPTSVTTNDDQLRAAQDLTRQKAGLSSDGTNPAEPTERIVSCGRCITVRRAPVANQIRQTMNVAIGVYEPPMCQDCFAFNEAELERLHVSQEQREKAFELVNTQAPMRIAGLPEPYVVGKRGFANLGDGPKTDTYERARATVDKLLTGQLDAPWVYLCGENGTFKSTVACVALQMAIQAGLEGRYEFWPNTLNELRALNRDDAPESVARYIDRLVAVPRIVFDEVGFGTPTNFAVETLGVIFERRYQLDSAAEPGRRWIIFTSNRSVEQLVKSFAPFDDFLMAPRLERRIAEMSTEIQIVREAA